MGFGFKIKNPKGDPEKIVLKYGFVVFKITAQNTQINEQNWQPSKL